MPNDNEQSYVPFYPETWPKKEETATPNPPIPEWSKPRPNPPLNMPSDPVNERREED